MKDVRMSAVPEVEIDYTKPLHREVEDFVVGVGQELDLGNFFGSRCEDGCGWPGNAPSEILADTPEQARQQAKRLHDDAQAQFAPHLRCKATPRVLPIR